MDSRSDDELILEVKPARAVSASDLAQLLGDMARDYHRFSRGSELIVGALNEGPRIALRNAMDGAGTNRLPAFGRRVARLLALARGGDGTSYRLRKTGAPAVDSLTKLAMACESVELRYRSAKGERVLLTLNPSEAQSAQEHIGEARQRKREIAAARKEERVRWPAATPSSDEELRAILSQWTNQAEE